MLKKLIIAVISGSFIASAAFADTTSIGLRISAATLAATGSTTTDRAASDASNTYNSGGVAVNHKEKDGDFELPSIFIEHAISVNDAFSMNVGVDYVPMTEKVASLDGTSGTNADVSAGNLLTMYVQPTFAINDILSVYAKAGYSTGDLEIRNVVKGGATAAQTNDDASTDTNQDKTLAGPIVGLGVQFKPTFGLVSFIRIEGTHTDFDQITHVNSNGKVSKADAEMDLITLSIGKSF